MIRTPRQRSTEAMPGPVKVSKKLACARLLALLLPFRLQLLAAFAGMALVAATEPALVWLVKLIVDHRFGAHWISHSWLTIPALLAGLFALRGLAGVLTGYLMLSISSQLLVALQNTVYGAAMAALDQGGKGQAGAVLNAIVVEGRNGTELVERVLIKFFRSLFSVLALLAMLLASHLWLGLACMLFAVPFMYAVRKTGAWYEEAARQYVETQSRMAGFAEESARLLPLIRQYTAQDQERGRFAELGERVRLSFARMAGIAGAMVPLTQLVAGLFLALLFAVKPWIGAQVSAGDFLAFVTNLLLMMVPLRDLAEVNGAMLRGLVGALTVFSTAELATERSGGQSFKSPPAGRIEFQDVWFSYEGAMLPTLCGINLRIQAGETVGLVGKSGSGKSTLLSMIPELCQPNRGHVRIDGQCIDTLRLLEVRAHVAMLGQQVELVDGSIAANVSFGDPFPDAERIGQALEHALLGPMVAGLPQGVHTVVGRHGYKLSGGQRQLLAIARVFYRNCPIVLLDEPTAALDHGSEQLLQRALRAVCRGRTTLIATHNLSTLAGVDRIIVLEQGQVAGSYLPHELDGRLAGMPAPAGRAAAHLDFST